MLNYVKIYTKDDKFVKQFNNTFSEMEEYIKIFKPKVVLDRENLKQINGTINIINSLIPDQSRLNFILKFFYFLQIRKCNKRYSIRYKKHKCTKKCINTVIYEISTKNK